MELKNIEKLLEKYWEGETNSLEENVLKEFFLRGTVPAHLKKEATLFSYYNQQKEIKIEKLSFEKELLDRIKGLRISKFSWYKIAASFLLLFASILVVLQLSKEADPITAVANNTITYEDPEKAYQETKKALMMISTKLNAPEKYTDEIGKLNDASGLFK